MHVSFRHRIAQVVTAGVAAIGLLAVSACGAAQKSSASPKEMKSDSTISVVASINQWGSLAQELGGNHVHVTNIMTNTNVEVHEYEPTASDIAKISKATVAVINGADYDPWAKKALASTSAHVIDAASLGGIHEGDNPHVWFSSKVRLATADALTALYKQLDSSHKQDYDNLNSQWHSREQKLEDSIKKARTKTEGMPYAATESVAKYLADDLHMKDKTPAGYASASANESEPSPSDIKEFQDLLTSKGAKLLFFNTQEANDETNRIVNTAKEQKIGIIELTEQMPSKYNTLVDWMQDLVNHIAA